MSLECDVCRLSDYDPGRRTLTIKDRHAQYSGRLKGYGTWERNYRPSVLCPEHKNPHWERFVDDLLYRIWNDLKDLE